MIHKAKLRLLERPTDSNDQQLFQVQPVLPTTRYPTLGPRTMGHLEEKHHPRYVK